MGTYSQTLQERYASLIVKKLRANLVAKDGIVFNTSYEGDPKAGAVKVLKREDGAVAGDYNATTGMEASPVTNSYITVTIDKDKAVNEIIDGFEAAAVPDNVLADRLDAAGYRLALAIDKDGIAELEATNTAHTEGTEKITNANVYKMFVEARTQLSKANVPVDRRFAIVSPEVAGLLLTAPEFIKASALGDAVVQSGAIGKVAGFTVFESNNLNSQTDFIAGHPDFCTRVLEWKVLPTVKDADSKFIGASVVQGRMVYAHKVLRNEAVIVKKNA